MTARLPVVGGDISSWGTVLNTFLQVAHNADGTLNTVGLAAKIFGLYPVYDYGAKGDGVTDDTSAFQAAINAAVNANALGVWVGAGHFLLSSTLVANRGIALIGSGTQDDTTIDNGNADTSTSLIWKTGSGAHPMIQFISGTAGNALFGGGVQNLSLDGNHEASIGIYASQTKRQRFQDLAAYKFVTAGIQFDDNNGASELSQSNVVDNYQYTWGTLAASQNSHGIVISGISGSAGATQHTLREIEGLVYNGYLIFLQNTDNNHVTKVHGVQQAGGTGGALIFKNALGGGSAKPARFNEIGYVNGNIVAESATYGNTVRLWDDESSTVTVAPGGLLYIAQTLVTETPGTSSIYTGVPGREEQRRTKIGYVDQTFDLPAASGSSPLTSGSVYAGAVYLHRNDVVTNLLAGVQQAGAGTNPTLIRMGLLDANGVVKAVTADSHADAKWQSAGLVSFPLTAPFTVTVDGLYYLALIEVGAFGTTVLNLVRGTTIAPAGAALSGAAPRYGTFGTAQTDLQAVGVSQPAFAQGQPAFWLAWN